MGASGLEVFCTFTYFFCIDGETEVTVKGKEHSYKKPVSEVEKGEFVLTYNGNDLIYSKVKENKREEGQRTFFTFKIKDKNSGFKTITVTDNHPILVFNKEKDIEPEFKNASSIKKGDLTRTTEGISEIVEINKELKNVCYKFVVEQGTVLANDILVGAFYFKENENKKIIKSIIDKSKIPITEVN